jgi:hypothetical protein
MMSELIMSSFHTVVVENSAGDKEPMVQAAYEFVLAEQKRVIAEENVKLIERYASLRSYFERRLVEGEEAKIPPGQGPRGRRVASEEAGKHMGPIGVMVSPVTELSFFERAHALRVGVGN